MKSDYRGYQIEVVAFQIEDSWDADIRIRRTPSNAMMCAGQLACRKSTAKMAEESGAVCARQWVDRYAHVA
jgi:hypothetical protein